MVTATLLGWPDGPEAARLEAGSLQAAQADPQQAARDDGEERQRADWLTEPKHPGRKTYVGSSESDL